MQIKNYPLLKKVLGPFYGGYKNAVSGVLSIPLRAYASCQRGGVEKARSVLHVSCLSHKPFMLSRLMREKGLKSDYLAIEAGSGWLQVGERGYDFNVDYSGCPYILRPWMVYYHIWRTVLKYDVIHFHFASFISHDGHELEYLKKMGKVIVFHFRGCDLRQRSINIRMNPDLNCCSECDYPPGSCETAVQAKRIALARKYADLLFVTTPDLRDFLPEAEHIPFIAPFGVDVEAITPAQRDKSVFRVVTSSNHHSVDGTRFVREAVSRLKQEGRIIELVEVFKTPYEKALGIYKSADVYVGKLRMGYYNNANIECMGLGVPCMSYIREEFLKEIPDCPIIITRPETVYQRLKEYIDRPQELREIGLRGIEFVRRHHDPGKIVDLIMGRYNAILRKRARIGRKRA